MSMFYAGGNLKRSILAQCVCVFFVALIAAPAFAICGDVNGDEAVSAADALAVLRRAVGLAGELECAVEPLVIENYVGFTNRLTCNGSSVLATMTWSEHPELTWSDRSQPSPPWRADYKRVDDLFLGGIITINYGACGSTKYDIDSFNVIYPLAPVGAAVVNPSYESSSNTLWINIELAAISTSLAARGAEPQRFRIGPIPAPAGLDNAFTAHGP